MPTALISVIGSDSFRNFKAVMTYSCTALESLASSGKGTVIIFSANAFQLLAWLMAVSLSRAPMSSDHCAWKRGKLGGEYYINRERKGGREGEEARAYLIHRLTLQLERQQQSIDITQTSGQPEFSSSSSNIHIHSID